MRNLVRFRGLPLFVANVLLGLVAIADEPGPWRITPRVVKEATPADRQAREELRKLIEIKQEDDFRKHWAIDVPIHGTGIPATYDVLLYCSYGNWASSATRLEVRVRGERATVELCNHEGFFRVARESKDIDLLVRQLAYAFQAAEREVKDGGTHGISMASHAPYQTIEVYSRDPDWPCHLKTPAWQALGNDISIFTRGLRGYLHTRMSEELQKMARKECERLSPADEQREILARLRRVPLENTDKEDYLRTDLAAVEGTLYGHLAVQRKLTDALPELRRLGLKDEAKHLEIMTAANPEPLIKEAILAFRADSHLAYWAIDFAKDKQHPERLQWLIDVLPKDISPYNAKEILEHLASTQLTKSQIGQIEKLYGQTEKQIVKVCAADLLLQATDDPQYFTYLEEVARAPIAGDKVDYLNPRSKAIGCLLDYSSDTGKQRERAYVLLKLLIAEQETQEKPELTRYALALGHLGSPVDVPFLIKFAERDSPHEAGFAIDALANIEPFAALEVLHRRIARNNRSRDENYRWEVWEHLDLVMAERDRAAIPLLKQAWDWHVEQYPKAAEKDYASPKLVIAFLEAKSANERVDVALDCVRQFYLRESQVIRISEELRKEGAGAEKCELLLCANSASLAAGKFPNTALMSAKWNGGPLSSLPWVIHARRARDLQG